MAMSIDELITMSKNVGLAALDGCPADTYEKMTEFKINEEKELNRTNGDIKVITQFIDELNLDNTLFKKLSINNEQIN